jgi:TonB-linked SusC/RagA family outer membrane protein
MYNFYPKKLVQPPGCAPNILLIMKLTTLILVAAILQVSAATYAQKITLSEKNTPLNKVFEKISDQTGYDFIVSTENLQHSKAVTIKVQNEELKSALDRIFLTQPLTFMIQEKMVVVSNKDNLTNNIRNKNVTSIPVKGIVTDTAGTPLPGATVQVKNGTAGVTTNSDGVFTILANENDVIEASFIGFQPSSFLVRANTGLQKVILHSIPSKLNEVQVIGYGTTTKRLNTGNVVTVSSETISKQPVANPLATLEGQVTGLTITQSSGVNGAGIKVQLRGQNSLIQGSDPLFIIDGVPIASGNISINQLSSAAASGSSGNSGISPFSLINPADIESISVLKDADATAIYGSRGANGVILITTRQGKAGKTVFNASIYTGISEVTRTMGMLNTQQFVQMRKEANKNDGTMATVTNSPDLLLWDTTRYTDFKKLLIGNKAHTTDAQISFSGGNANTQFLIGGGLHRETTVFPTPLGDNKGTVHLNLNHHTSDQKLRLNASVIYAADINKLPVSDLTTAIRTAPNLKLYDDAGKLNWQEGGVSYISLGLGNANPLSFINQSYTGKFQNLNSNLQISYLLLTGLSFKVNLGYNVINSDESSLFPSTSLDPNTNQLPYSYFGYQSQKSWIIEPQVEYNKWLGHGKLNILVGNTWQDISASGIIVSASNYSSDLLLGSVSAAGSAQTTNSFNQYRYNGFYGRLNYQLQDKYIFNLSGRRDGSSRFGPANRFSNFAAVGAAWIFSQEDLVQKTLPFLSFGKFRSSYGLTGNDQIGNYKYLDAWTPGNTTYQGNSILNPVSLYNPNYSWEKNKKFEVGVDVGIFKDKVLFSAAYFDNRSNNQLINYTLPTQTGFTSVLQNRNALIQNTGLEFQVSSLNFKTNNLSWTTTANLTIPHNKLLDFPGLSGSSYANTYVIGQSLSTRKVYQYLGVDPTNGIYKFTDVDNNGLLNAVDKIVLQNTDIQFFGGIQNTFTYKQLDLSIFFEFKKQTGLNYLNTLSGIIPGTPYFNQPAVVLNRWQKPGDITNIQKFSALYTDVFTAANNYLPPSEAIYSDASYIRCKNVALSYRLPEILLNKLHVSGLRIYLQGQNLFTLTNYIGADPENQDMYVLPPLRTITAGFQLTL